MPLFFFSFVFGRCFLKMLGVMVERIYLTVPQETECLLSKLAVVTETPAAPRGDQKPPPPPPGHIRALLYKFLTSRCPSRWAYLKLTHNQSMGPCREAGIEQRPITVPLGAPAYEKEVDITRQSAWLLERAARFLNWRWQPPAGNAGVGERNQRLKRWISQDFCLSGEDSVVW